MKQSRFIWQLLKRTPSCFCRRKLFHSLFFKQKPNNRLEQSFFLSSLQHAEDCRALSPTPRLLILQRDSAPRVSSLALQSKERRESAIAAAELSDGQSGCEVGKIRRQAAECKRPHFVCSQTISAVVALRPAGQPGSSTSPTGGNETHTPPMKKKNLPCVCARVYVHVCVCVSRGSCSFHVFGWQCGSLK